MRNDDDRLAQAARKIRVHGRSDGYRHIQPAHAAYDAPAPVSERLAQRVLSLSMSADPSAADQDQVVAPHTKAVAAPA